MESGFGFCSVIFGWDMHDRTYFRELLISNSQNGYRDLLAKVDLRSFRRIPWEDAGAGHGSSSKGVPFFLVSFYNPDSGKPIPPCPRGLLGNIVTRVGEKGWKAMAGGWFSVPLKFSCNQEHNKKYNSKFVCSRVWIFQFPRNSKKPWREQRSGLRTFNTRDVWILPYQTCTKPRVLLWYFRCLWVFRPRVTTTEHITIYKKKP